MESAINTTVDVAGTLEFAINGQDETADLEALDEAGYSVEFLASENVFTGGKNKSTNGVVDAAAGTKFEYQVEITKGDEKYTSARQSVEVQAYADTVIAITKVETTVTSLEVADGKLALGDTAQITVKGTVKGNDKEQTLPAATYKVDRPAVLTVNPQGEVTPNAKGTATVTVTVGDLTEKVTYTVGDARKVDATKSTIDQLAVEVAAGKTAKVVVDLKDQYGLAFTDTVTADNAEGVSVLSKKAESDDVVLAKDTDGSNIAGKYNVTLTTASKAATGDVVVKAGTVEIGKVNVTVKEAGEVASYKLEVASTEFDLKTNDGKADKTLTLKAFDKGGLETALTGNFKFESSDKDVVTVNEDTGVVTLTGAEAGETAKVIAKKVTGAFKDVVAEIEFTVVDSTPVITDVKFTSTPAITAASSIDLDKILKVTAEGSKGEVKVAYTVADGNASINIFEADAQGAATDVNLGAVQLTKLPTGLGVSFAQVEETAKATVNVTLVPQTAGGESPQPAQNKGSFNIAVIDKDDNFKGDTTIGVNITTITAAADALDTIKAFGFGGEVENLEAKAEDELSGVNQVATTLENVATFLDVQYGATLNVANIKAENGTIKITGPLLSAADFTKIKGDKAGAYRLTIEGVAKIAISADGTAVFEALN